MKKKPFGKMYVVRWEMCSTIKVSKVQIVFSKLPFMDRNVNVICLFTLFFHNYEYQKKGHLSILLSRLARYS